MNSTKTRTHYAAARIVRSWRHLCLVTTLVVMLFTTFISTAPAYAAPVARTSDTTTGTGTPNTAPTPTNNTPTNTHAGPPFGKPFPGISLPAHADTTIHRAFTPKMTPLDLILQPGVATTARSSDNALDVAVPATTVSAADVTTLLGASAPATDKPHLIVTQILPASGSTSGGVISTGTYLFQVQDGHGHEVTSGVGLKNPITVTYHWPSATPAVPLDRFFVTLNGATPVTVGAKHLGPTSHQPTTVVPPLATTNPTAAASDVTGAKPSLSASLLLTASSTASSFDSNAPEGYFSKPDSLQNDLHTGDLTTGISLDVPAGPGGLTPPVKLAYSSAAVSSTHSVQAAAPWVGDGWSLDPGAITWSESLDGAMPTNYQWQNTWSISDPFGTSGTLVPPSTDIATFFDDTTHVYYNPTNSTYPHPVVQWHTAPESHAKIISYVGTNSVNGMPANAPCWRVWLPNGDMEEFGCTTDSLQWYPAGSDGHTSYVSAWKLDLVTDPSGNQIHYIYDQDTTVSPQGVTYPRDVALNRIEWDSPACHNAQAACTGAAWAPLYKVTFAHTNSVAHVYPGARSCSPQTGGLRCDDPAAAQAGVIDMGTPLETTTQVLNDVRVTVFANGAWNQLRNYRFAYDQGALSPNRIDDPGTGHTMSVAGFLLLDQVQETGTDGATAYPAQVFKYLVPLSQYYEDSNYHPANMSADCGPVWNTGKKADGTTSGCLLWSRSYNGFYMSEADNGEGLLQTFSWDNFRTNQHDPVNGTDWTNPVVCNVAEQSQGASTGYPCDMPDDNGWSHVALTSKTVTENSPTSANASAQTTGTWNYAYRHAWLTAIECSDCGVGMYWGNTNSLDYQDYYNGQFKGFAYVQQINPDGSTINDSFYTTEGWGVYDNTQVVACYNGHGGTGGCSGDNSPNSDLTNAAAGSLYEEDVTAPQSGSDWPLLKVTKTTWQRTCPPTWIGASPAVSFTAPNSLHTGTVTMNLNWDGNLVAEVDPYNPVMVCDIQQAKSETFTPDGTITYGNRGTLTTNNAPYLSVASSYSANWYGQLSQQVTTGNDLSSTPTTTTTHAYIWDDAITTTNTSATGTYIVDRAANTVVQDPTQTSVQCTYHDYDGGSYASGFQSGLTKGLETGTEHYTVCTSFLYANWTATDTSYNANGDPINTTDADALHGVTGHTATTGSCTSYTACSGYDSTYGTLPATSTNVLNQTTTTNYTTAAATGFGQWPSSGTDANGQVTSSAYDPLGRVTNTTLPGETSGLTTATLLYTVACNATGADSPCLEVDTTQRLNSTTTVLKRNFYDGEGQHVESRTAAPGGQDVVQYALYDNQGRMYFTSQPYFVTAYTGGAGKAAYSTPDVTKVGTTTTYDALGRVTSSTDANAKTTTTSYSNVCAPAGTEGDQACYNNAATIDANLHKSQGLIDALGRGIYDQSYSGNSSGTYAQYRTSKAQYDVLGDKVGGYYADGTHQPSATYDGLQRETAYTDPDLGSYTITYDQNGNGLSSTDPRGASGTVYTSYDGRNRIRTRSTHSDGSSPLASYSYDSTASGNQGIGHLTGETFASGPSQSVTGSYAYTYDTRGRQTTWAMTLGTTNYPFTLGYNDLNQQTTLTYPDGDVVTTSYGAQGWLAGVTEVKGSTTNTLLNTVSYTGANGASELPTSASVGNGVYTWNLGYDTDLRLSETKATQVSNSAVLFDQKRGFDAIGNVTSTATTVVAGTDNQVFCYDEQNRLVWAGSQGTPSCGVSLTPGTLTSGGARYTQAYSYDVLNRLTNGPLGSGYTYGDTNHLDAVTSAPSYTAGYDTAGNMTSRSGQALSYDALREMVSWQNAATNPTQTASYAYNGEGQRVQQVVNVSGTITTTKYIGTYEDLVTTGSTTTTTKYYQVGKVGTAESVNGILSYQVNDNLGSVSEALTASGGVQATELYAPFGTVRYSNGTMPTSYGYTKMRQDPSGLNYDNARYYDPGAGQFTAADSVVGPNRYAYVSNNPETVTDPSGNCPWCITALIGAAVGAGIAYGSQVVHNVQQHGLTASAFTHVDAGAILKAAVAGAIIGAGGALLEGAIAGVGLGTGLVAKVVVGAATGAGGQMLDNAMNGKPLFDDVGKATLMGAGTALLTAGAMAFLKGRFGGSASDADTGGGAGAGCSFDGHTRVATPTGNQAIDTLKVGDQVTAYDSKTGKSQAETVQQVFANSDSDLLDVTITDDNLKTVATKNKQPSIPFVINNSQALHAETLHTTSEHPFLTNDHGFVAAMNLVPGEHIRNLDGNLGVVVAVTIVPGQAVRYNLTVQDEHTFAVGQGQWVVHNVCSGPYKNVQGHHIHAKAAFDGNSLYDAGDALCLCKTELLGFGGAFDHQAITNMQRNLFKRLSNDVQAGIRQNIMSEHNDIAYQSLLAGGVGANDAANLVQQSLSNLTGRGISAPSRIPWN